MTFHRQQIPDEVIAICEKLCQAGHQAFLVGGGVRDLLLGRPVHDWDVATSAHPEQVQGLFRKTVPIGIEHGTVAVLTREAGQVEVTTFRGEAAYSDGRHPDSVTFVSSLDQDLERRDFTINAMALDPLSLELVDPLQGEQDLEGKLIRAVGNPGERFEEDALRIMRAVRFATVLEFELDPATLQAIPSALQRFGKVSAERVRDELLKLLEARRPSRGMELMRQSGLLALVLPELLGTVGQRQNRYHAEDLYTHLLAACDATEGDAVLRLAALLHDLGKPEVAEPHPEREGELRFHGHEGVGAEICEAIGRRLRLSRAATERMVQLVRHHNFQLQGWKSAGLRRFVRRVGEERLEDLFALRRGDLLGRDGPDQTGELEQMWQQLQQLLAERPALEVKQLAIGGARLMQELGLAPGPQIGKLLRALLEQVLEDPGLNTEEQLLSKAREILSRVRAS